MSCFALFFAQKKKWSGLVFFLLSNQFSAYNYVVIIIIMIFFLHCFLRDSEFFFTKSITFYLDFRTIFFPLDRSIRTRIRFLSLFARYLPGCSSLSHRFAFDCCGQLSFFYSLVEIIPLWWWWSSFMLPLLFHDYYYWKNIIDDIFRSSPNLIDILWKILLVCFKNEKKNK